MHGVRTRQEHTLYCRAMGPPYMTKLPTTAWLHSCAQQALSTKHAVAATLPLTKISYNSVSGVAPSGKLPASTYLPGMAASKPQKEGRKRHGVVARRKTGCCSASGEENGAGEGGRINIPLSLSLLSRRPGAHHKHSGTHLIFISSSSARRHLLLPHAHVRACLRAHPVCLACPSLVNCCLFSMALSSHLRKQASSSFVSSPPAHPLLILLLTSISSKYHHLRKICHHLSLLVHPLLQPHTSTCLL